jgi:hypothetical protein
MYVCINKGIPKTEKGIQTHEMRGECRRQETFCSHVRIVGTQLTVNVAELVVGSEVCRGKGGSRCKCGGRALDVIIVVHVASQP